MYEPCKTLHALGAWCMFAKIRLEPKMAANIMFANYGKYKYINVKTKIIIHYMGLN